MPMSANNCNMRVSFVFKKEHSVSIEIQSNNQVNLQQETEEERLQLAQKLVGLCTSILKVGRVSLLLFLFVPKETYALRLFIKIVFRDSSLALLNQNFAGCWYNESSA